MLPHDIQTFEKQCLQRWDFVENSWKGWGIAYPLDAYMRRLITSLRAQGYDRKLFPHTNYTMVNLHNTGSVNFHTK